MKITQDHDEAVILNVVLSELYQDLLTAVNEYIADLCRNPAMLATANKVMEKLVNPVPQSELQKKCGAVLNGSEFTYILTNLNVL